MKIALIGTRGVPANYGGYETCVEELGKRLAERGHDVTVYCRASYYTERPATYFGMKLVYLPNIKKKSLDTLSHTFLSIIHAVTHKIDILMVFNVANTLTFFLPRLLGKKIAVNTDGFEWKRGKWGRMGKLYYKFSEWLSTKLANRIVADALAMQDYYLQKFGVESSYIAYGAYNSKSTKPELINKLGVIPGEYFLQITLFRPENNVLLTIEAFKKLNTDKKLLIIGGGPYQSDYSREIEAAACENIIIPGTIYDKDMINELWCNCFAYIHGNGVGGTNPALLQSMASGSFTIAVNVVFSHEVLDNGGIYYDKNAESLSIKMNWALENPSLLSEYTEKARHRIKDRYTWDIITDGYEQLFKELQANKYPWRLFN